MRADPRAPVRRGAHSNARTHAIISLQPQRRYVSGYLRSTSKVVGAEDSHAWVSAWCPDIGWFDVDPANDVIPAEGHLKLAWGRDYGEVASAAQRNPTVPARSLDGAISRYFPCSVTLYACGKYQSEPCG